MNNHPTNQWFTPILLFLSAFLQSCMPSLKLGYEPFNNQKDKNAQEVLHSSAHQAKYQPILIPATCLEQGLATAPIEAYRFKAASGEVVSFLQENGLWKARVKDGPKQLSFTSDLPVIFQKSEAMLTLLQSLSKEKASIHKHHIHILNSDHGKYVFVGTLGLPGGMEEKEETYLLPNAIRSRRWKAIKTILATSRVGQVSIINRQDKQGNSPLHIAAQCGDVRVLRWLLYRLHNYAWEYGNDSNNISLIINTPNNQRQTALHLASIGGHRKVIKYLLRANANPNLADIYGRTPLHYAARNGSREELAMLFLQHSDNPNLADIDGRTPLHEAAISGHLQLAQELLARDVNPNLADMHGRTPLHYAARNGSREELAMLFLQHSDNPNLADIDGRTPLHEAAISGHLQLAQELLARDVNPNLADMHGRTPLHYAARNGSREELAMLFLQHSDNPNLADIDGRTPLHEAAISGHLQLAQELLARDVNPNLADMHGRTPLHKAAISGHLQLAQRLLALGANPNLCDMHGHTPLHYAKQTPMQNLLNGFMHEQKQMLQPTE